MANFSVTVRGLSEMQAKLRSLAQEMPQDVALALYQEAESEMTEAKARTPVDTGALKGSGHVRQPEIGLNGVSVKMGFGGPAVDYAVQVHEDLEAFHPTGQAKFLESVLQESAPHMAERIAKRIDLNRVAR